MHLTHAADAARTLLPCRLSDFQNLEPFSPSSEHPPSHDDCHAVLRLQSGDDQALGEIIERWRQPLLRFIRRHVSCDWDAAELTHETFIRVYENCARYQPKAKFSTWLFTIAANLCRNHTRWQTRHPSAELDEQVADAARSPSEAVEAEELATAVQRCLENLPEELRIVFVLRTVETRLQRAREILRRDLSELHKS
jgi:RNA polymerase sigma-70 factor (ECF subfamily)